MQKGFPVWLYSVTPTKQLGSLRCNGLHRSWVIAAAQKAPGPALGAFVSRGLCCMNPVNAESLRSDSTGRRHPWVLARGFDFSDGEGPSPLRPQFLNDPEWK